MKTQHNKIVIKRTVYGKLINDWGLSIPSESEKEASDYFKGVITREVELPNDMGQNIYLDEYILKDGSKEFNFPGSSSKRHTLVGDKALEKFKKLTGFTPKTFDKMFFLIHGRLNNSFLEWKGRYIRRWGKEHYNKYYNEDGTEKKKEKV